MKKLLSILVIVCVLLSSSIGISASAACSSSHYSDVSVYASYYDAVCYLFDHGIMSGTGYGQFTPSGSVTRSQIITVIWNMLNKPSPVGSVQSFGDCSSGAFYYDAVRWASSSGVGIVAGYPNGNFGPNDNVSQQDTYAFLYRMVCYCQYISKTTSSEASYKNILANSNLTYRNNVSEYAKPAFGWAYSVGLTLSANVNPKSTAVRSNIAQYAYKIFQKYQKKYALTVVCTDGMDYAVTCGNAMAKLFRHYNATCVSKVDIASSQFSTAMKSAFSRAKPLDMCYIFLQAHGGKSGVGLWPAGGTLAPATLRSEILKNKGQFVVMISSCFSGGYISQSVGDVTTASTLEDNGDSSTPVVNEDVCSSIPNQNGNGNSGTPVLEDNGSSTLVSGEGNVIQPVEEDTFDPEWFTRVLAGLEEQDGVASTNTDLTGSNRIKVLCSSKHEETSYDSDERVVKYWCLGAGYDYMNDIYTSLVADTNSDNRISLEELYKYSYDKIIKFGEETEKQHVVRYPKNDKYIILETGY